MPKFTSIETETDVRRLSKEKYSKVDIKKKLKEENVDISVATITRILKNIGIRRQAISKNEPVQKFRRPPIKRTPQMIQKVKSLIQNKNPASYRQIQNKTGLSPPTIHKVIHQDLGKVSRKKTKVHRLSNNHKKNRKTNCRKLYEHHLAGEKSEFAVTLDEALIYEHETNGQSRICYVGRGENVPDDWVIEDGESFSKCFMVVGVISGRGTIPLFRVPASVKINAQYYVNYVLEPLFTVHLPRLYPNEINKVFLHHDKATSHTANLTTNYLNKMKRDFGISFIGKDDIPVKSPDGSPLDFFGFGYLKQRLLKRRARTLDGVWKICQEEWLKIDLDLIKSVFSSWKRRLRLISARDGAHIEQTKKIHSKLFKPKF